MCSRSVVLKTKVICPLPLGVLKHGDVTFEPPLSALVMVYGLVTFEPAEPTCAQCICRLAGDSEALERARDAAAAQTGAKVFRKLRSGDGGTQFFEWTLGPNNLDVDDDVFLEAWAAFAAALES